MYLMNYITIEILMKEEKQRKFYFFRYKLNRLHDVGNHIITIPYTEGLCLIRVNISEQG